MLRTPEEFHSWVTSHEELWITVMHQAVKKENRRTAEWIIKRPPPKKDKVALVFQYLGNTLNREVMSAQTDHMAAFTEVFKKDRQ